MHINGLNVLITGGGAGLGAATARKLTDLGARVAILDLPISIDISKSSFLMQH